MPKYSEDRFKGIANKERMGSGQGEIEETLQAPPPCTGRRRGEGGRKG